MDQNDDLRSPISEAELRHLHELGDGILTDLALRDYVPAHVMGSNGLQHDLSALLLVVVPNGDPHLVRLLQYLEEYAVQLLALDSKAIVHQSEEPI